MFLEQTIKVVRCEGNCSCSFGPSKSFSCANAETACSTHYGDGARSYKVSSVHSVFEAFAHDGRSFRVIDGSMKFISLSSLADQICSATTLLFTRQAADGLADANSDSDSNVISHFQDCEVEVRQIIPKKRAEA
jgi:hypothetical protein